MIINLTSPIFLAGVAVLGATIFVSCRSTGSPGPEPLAMQTVTQGPSSAITDERCIAIRTQDEFDALWREHGKLQLPPPKAPNLDFEERMVVAVFLGSRPTAGYAVEIRGVDLHPARVGDGVEAALMVRAVESDPIEGAMVPQMTTAPFHMVQVARADGELALELSR